MVTGSPNNNKHTTIRGCISCSYLAEEAEAGSREQEICYFFTKEMLKTQTGKK